jgi:hypothetical protein
VRARTPRDFVASRTRNLVSLLRRHLRRFDVRREGFHAAQTARRAPKQKTRLRILASHRLCVVAVLLVPSSRASARERDVFRRHRSRVRTRTRRARAIEDGRSTLKERRVTRRLADASRATTTVDTRAREIDAKRARNARRTRDVERTERTARAGGSDPRVESFFNTFLSFRVFLAKAWRDAACRG